MAKYDEFLSPKNEGRPVLVEAARRDGSGKNIENNYAKQNGYYSTMTVGVADQLSPYDDESGDEQDEPFIFQATGTANGTQSDFATGSIALMKEKQGNTVVVNQKCSVYTGSWTTSDYNDLSLHNSSSTFVTNHKYLFMVEQSVELTSAVRNIFLINISGSNSAFTNYGTKDSGNLSLYAFENQNLEKGLKVCIFSCSSDVTGVIKYWVHTPSADVTMKNFAVIDLTQWFNGDIPQDLLDNPSNFFRYYQGSLAYNEGTLVNANGRYIKCIGMNQWDEEIEIGSIDSEGQNYADASGNYWRSKNYIKVIPNTDYYVKLQKNYTLYTSNIGLKFYDKDKNFITTIDNRANNHTKTPENACYMKFVVFLATPSQTAPQEIVVSIYYEGESGYDQYYPYEVLTNNDTGTEVLRSAGSVKDSKAPDGTITRRIGVVDLGTLTWTYEASPAEPDAPNVRVFYAEVSGAKGNWQTYGITQICAKYPSVPLSQGSRWKTGQSACRFGASSININIYDPTFANMSGSDVKSALSGVYLFYELAEPTTEQGTPYSENLVIDDFGSMDFGSDVPQGALIFYPADYKAFVDTLYKYTDGTPSNVALNSELTEVDNKHDALYNIVKENLGGILRHQLVDENSGLDFENTAYLDLSDENMNWYEVTGGFSSGQLPVDTQLPSGERGVLAKILCPKYQVITSDEQYAETKIGICLGGGGIGSERTIRVCDNRYTLEQFKNAMKGILMAYKKAE